MRKALRASYAANDALIERIDEMERDHEAEMAEMCAQHARELNRSRSVGSKGGSKGEPDKGGANGAALLNGPATPPPMNPVKYARSKAYLKAKGEGRERANGGFEPPPATRVGARTACGGTTPTRASAPRAGTRAIV